jgi:copper homeostasis protein CutC
MIFIQPFVGRATKGGCTRLELCGNLGIGGGTTPSVGLLRTIRKTLPDAQIMVTHPVRKFRLFA